MSTLHLRIRASAGTGKTFRLTDRVIELLILGVSPDKLIALTFTRKAAGEFLQKTLLKLATLAKSQHAADVFCQRTKQTQTLTSQTFLGLLRDFVRVLDRLEFGTLDGFFYRIVATFAPQLGLRTTPRILSEAERLTSERELMSEVAHELMQKGVNLVEELLRGPGRATLDPFDGDFDLLRKIEAFYALHPHAQAWGDPRTIWGQGGNPWPVCEVPTGPFRTEVEQAIAEINSLGRPAAKINTLAKRWLEAAAEFRGAGPVTVPFNKKEMTISGDEFAAVRAAIFNCLHRTIELKLTKSKRWHEIGSVIHRLRARRFAAGEGLRFEDLPLLAAGLPTCSADLAYRLDGWFDHWLLDEFQDTNRLQWRALEPLVDEVIQDTSGRRSFFYVGDVKQSIYGFRAGEPRLFDEIFAKYTEHSSGHIGEESLEESYRSGEQILDLVNATFAPESLLAAGLPEHATWRPAWAPHRAHPTIKERGNISYISCPLPDYWSKIADIVRTTGVLGRTNLSCAVLVETNKVAREAVQAFGRLGLSATTESRPLLSTTDPWAVAVHMAARLVADPEDRLALGALRAGPLAAAEATILQEGVKDFSLLGAAGTIARWLPLEHDAGPPPLLAAALRRAGAEFDQTGSRNPFDFVQFFSTCEDVVYGRPGTIQVMTIHKAKGLEYDLVFLAHTKSQRMDALQGSSLYCHEGRQPWILELPAEFLAQADDVLLRASEAQRRGAAFDRLCRFYVGQTRARQGLVIITPEAKTSTASAGSSRDFLARAFDSLPPAQPHEEWFPAAGQETPNVLPSSVVQPRTRTSSMARLRPSDQGHGSLVGASLFSQTGGLSVGSDVHDFLEAIEWHSSDFTKFPTSEAERLAIAFLQSEAGLVAFRRPSATSIVWRERAVACYLEGSFVSAQMDRVMITPPTEELGEIFLIDFKTDQGPPDQIAARYLKQMETYVKILMAWSGGKHRVQAAIATIRTPMLIPVILG